MEVHIALALSVVAFGLSVAALWRGRPRKPAPFVPVAFEVCHPTFERPIGIDVCSLSAIDVRLGAVTAGLTDAGSKQGSE